MRDMRSSTQWAVVQMAMALMVQINGFGLGLRITINGSVGGRCCFSNCPSALTTISTADVRLSGSPRATGQPPSTPHNKRGWSSSSTSTSTSTSSLMTLSAAGVPDLAVVALVAGQENYGLAVVALGEGLYSFVKEPSFQNIKVLLPPVIAAILLVTVSGPMITSGDATSTGMGLWIATAVSLGLGVSYILRLLAPSYDTYVPKEVAALGLLVALAGLFSFGQNLVVDGFISLPSIPLPQILPMPPSENF